MMNRNAIFFLLLIFLILPYIVYSIATFTIQETEKISLIPNATDPDADKLLIIYTAPLNEKGEWQTNYGDAGEHKSTITVSDGFTNVSEDVLIIVKKMEVPPKIESFTPMEGNINIKEGDPIKFFISASDLNKDELQYSWFFDDKKVREGQEFIYNVAYNDSGSHKVSVFIFDGTVNVSKEWYIEVDDVDRFPIFENIGNKFLNENEELKIILNAYDPDGDQITFSASNLPEGAGFENNTFYWKPSYDTIKKVDFIDRVVDKFTPLSKSFYVKFTASSDHAKVVQNVVITVKDMNRLPVLEDMEPITINEDESLKISPDVYDLDGDKVSISYSGFIKSDYYKSNFGDAGIYYVKVTVDDGSGQTSKSVQINIKHVNRMPIFSKIETIKVSEGDNIAILLNAYDPDGDTINYSIDNAPQNSSINGNVFLWTPPYTLANKKETRKLDSVFVASDGKAETRQIVQVQISNKNRIPKIINATKSVVAKVNEPVLLFVKATDEDDDDLDYTWEFGLFEKYKATSTHKRIFTTTGTKIIKVIVSDGTDEVEQIINVNVI